MHRKWKLKFSASKSAVVCFTRQHKPGDDLAIPGWPPHSKQSEDQITRADPRLQTTLEISHPNGSRQMHSLKKCLLHHHQINLRSKHQKPMHPLKEHSPQPHRLRTANLRLSLQLQPTQNRSSTLHSQANTRFQAIHAKRSPIR